MKLSRITLYIYGSDLEKKESLPRYRGNELWERTKRAIGELCEAGSDAAACHVFYREEAEQLESDLSNALQRVQSSQANWRAKIDFNRICCVFMVNSCMPAEKWRDCIDRTCASVEAMNFTQVTNIAIVQKDNLKFEGSGLASVCANRGIAVYLFSQQTEDNAYRAFPDEECMLLSYYGALAGAQELDEETGVYTGSYNRTSLSSKDFDRIRTHYVLKALLREPGFENETLFNAIFGEWFNSETDSQKLSWTISSSDEAARAMIQKWILPKLPNPANYAILAGESSGETEENCNAFINENFEGEVYRSLLNEFETGKYGDSIIASWKKAFRKTLSVNAVYYSKQMADFMSANFGSWIRDMIRKLKELEPIHVTDSSDQRRYAIQYVQSQLLEYETVICEKVLKRLLNEIKIEARIIRRRVYARDEMIRQNSWILSAEELRFYEEYIDNTILQKIEELALRNITVNNLMSPSETYYDPSYDPEQPPKVRWENTVREKNREIASEISLRDSIDILNDKMDAEFTREVSAQLHDMNLRLRVTGHPCIQESKRIIYIYSNRLRLNTGRKFPGENLAVNVSLHAVNSDVSLLQFKVCALSTPDAVSGNEEAIAKILDMYSGSTRLVQNDEYADTLDPSAVSPESEEAQDSHNESDQLKFEPGFTNKRVTRVTVRIPESFLKGKSRYTYELKGYDDDGSVIHKESDEPASITGLTIQIPLDNCKGHCVLKFSINKGQNTGLSGIYEFDGPASAIARHYKQAKPGIFAKKSETIAVGGKQYVLEHRVYKLTDSKQTIRACLIGTENQLLFRYPIGEAKNGKWDIWVPAESSIDTILEADDQARVLRLEED